MHYFQKHILDTLRVQGPTTYRNLLPKDVESSHLRYHLGQLEIAGYVRKSEATKGYQLTTEGKIIVDYLSTKGTKLKRSPKVISYTLLRLNEKLFLYQKDKEPYLGLTGLVGGKIHFGEDVSRAAQREVNEKLGWEITIPDLVGIADIKTSEKGRTVSHVTAYVHEIDLAKLPANRPTQLVQTTLSDIADYDLMPDLIPLLDAIESAPPSGFILSLDL